MPKIVDHVRRRREIIEAVWRIIAEEGIEAATTRRIAEVTGRANGVLLYYFPNKRIVLRAALDYAFEETNRRADARDPERRGLSGLKVLCDEIMPLDETKRLEARLVLTSWQWALNSEESSVAFTAMMGVWRDEITRRLTEAQEDGEITESTDITRATGVIMSFLMGLQALSVFTPEQTTAEQQRADLDFFIASFSRSRPIPG